MELLAELLAFLSGLLLLRPAWRVNDILRQSAQLRAILKDSASNLERNTIPTIQKRLDETASNWNYWDQLCLRIGALLFVLSTLIKLSLALLPE